LGNVRSEKIKKSARELIRIFPDTFTSKFQENKEMLSSLAKISSKTLKNNIAGYITRLVNVSKMREKMETR
jgi:small subunit ribosomal protein S17e